MQRTRRELRFKNIIHHSVALQWRFAFEFLTDYFNGKIAVLTTGDDLRVLNDRLNSFFDRFRRHKTPRISKNKKILIAYFNAFEQQNQINHRNGEKEHQGDTKT